MEFMPKLLSRDESDAWVGPMKQHLAERGLAYWAVRLKADRSFVGAIGLSAPAYETPFSPFVEIGWRIGHAYWNKGLATEGARAVLHHAGATLHLREVVSFTVPMNLRSRRVMEKIGMIRDVAGDFDHPRLPAGHPLQRHVLYRWTAPSAMDRAASSGKIGLDG
jgi:ribosomal-protein-alanine N-acetyltransferase